MSNKLSQEQKLEIISLKSQGFSSRSIAEIVLGSKSKKSTVNDFFSREANSFKGILKTSKSPIINIVDEFKGAKVFCGDVEVSASVVYSFGRFKAFIKPDQVIQEPYMLTFAGKWLHSPAIISHKLTDYSSFDSDVTNDKELMQDLWHILNECDIFIAHNARFDVGWLNQRFAFWGIAPPSPYKVIDTLKEIRGAFSLPANSLAASANYFELPNRKLDNAGWSLWQRCMEGDPEAFLEMEVYNIGDITTLEDLYLKVRPWMKNHPNVALYAGDGKLRCPKCGSSNLIKVEDKTYSTMLSEFDLYYCPDSQSYCRGRKNLRDKEDMKATLLTVG